VRASHLFLTESDIQSLAPAVVGYLARPQLELWVLCARAGVLVGFMGLSGAAVDSLFIVPEHWRRGGGRLLIAHARHLKGPLTVDVNEQNRTALDFYLAMGFRVLHRSPVDSDGRPFPLLSLREDDVAVVAGAA
jgi:putative acetyltransferase